MTYTIHTRPWDDAKDSTYETHSETQGFKNWHWKLTRTLTRTSPPYNTIESVVASGFAATRDRARSKAERAAGKDQKRRAKADEPEETYAYEPDGS